MTSLFPLISIHNLQLHFVVAALTWHDELWRNLFSEVTAVLQDKHAIHLPQTATSWCGQTGFLSIHTQIYWN